jgi:hypothetical protein
MISEFILEEVSEQHSDPDDVCLVALGVARAQYTGPRLKVSLRAVREVLR